MEVYIPGFEVTLKGGVKATVISIEIKSTRLAGVTYQVAWWDGRTRMTAWISPPEINDGEYKTTIGFKQ